MDVRLIDPHDDGLLTRWHEITEAAMKHERPWVSVPSLESDRSRFRLEIPFDRAEAVAAFDGEDMVGAGYVIINQLGNRDKAWGSVAVEPHLRRRGIGAAVLALLVERARVADADYLFLQTSYPFEEREAIPTGGSPRPTGSRSTSTRSTAPSPCRCPRRSSSASRRRPARVTRATASRPGCTTSRSATSTRGWRCTTCSRSMHRPG